MLAELERGGMKTEVAPSGFGGCPCPWRVPSTAAQ